MNRAAQKLGRLGGLARSKAKTAACRKNGKKGGRPKKAQRPARRHNPSVLPPAAPAGREQRVVQIQNQEKTNEL